ncbi:MAG: glycosyltransferase [Pseudodonghicola sp.]
MSHPLLRFTARHRFSRFLRPVQRQILGLPFPPRARVRILIYHHADPICWSQIYPFFRTADSLETGFGAHVRALPVQDFLTQAPGPEADVVLVQPWLSETSETIETAFARYRDRHPGARLVFLDAYAQCDLRYGRAVAPYVDLYQRKALFRDRSQFLRPFAGDTNLTDYYGGLYGIPAAPVDWHVPPALLDRLRLVPNFLTADYLAEGFLGPEPEFDDRPIDLHARVATKGTPWYAAMRSAASAAAQRLEGITRTPTDRLSRRQFLDEMRQSRLCWSPFGYGELCWRDLEAFMTGAVLVKPDMSHLETLPDLYRPGETYLPVKWDFSDLETVVRRALADPEAQRRIARTAFAAARRYLTEGCFVTDTGRDLGLDT